VRRPRTRGVKCVVRDADGRIVFVRHTYGDRKSWELPGGGLRRREDAEPGIRREMREELGVELDRLRLVGHVEVAGSHKRTDLSCFEGFVPAGARLSIDPGELAEVRWAPPEEPPSPLGEDAAVLLELLLRGRRHG
jgi:ADP-ribose pyrophosphatase YjhB (NUDIX family)